LFQLRLGFSEERASSDVRRARSTGLTAVRHHVGQVSDERPSDVLGALPHRRPQRRSDKRRAREPVRSESPSGANGSAAAGATTAERPPASGAPTPRAKSPERDAPTPETSVPASLPTTPRATPRRRTTPLRQPAQPPGTPPASHERPADQVPGRHILGTAAQAAAELASIGLSLSARALRNAVDRLPRP
jgi:hypothetical protein